MNLKVLKNKSFLLLLFGQSTSLIGGQLFNIALSLYVLDLTGSALKFASILAIGIVPQIILYPFAGVFVDRLDRKKLIIFLDIFRGLFFLIIYLITYNTQLSIIHIYMITFISGLCDTLFMPATYTIIPFIFESDDYEDAYACNNMIQRISAVISPLLGTWLYTILGIKIVILIDGITFIISALSEGFISLKKIKKDSKDFNVFADIKEGFVVLFRLKSVLLFTSTFILFRVLVLPFFIIILPYFFKIVLEAPNYYVGIYRTVGIIGGFVGLLFVGKVKRKYGEIKVIELLTNRQMLFYIPLILLGISPLISIFRGGPIYALIFISSFLLIDSIFSSTVNVFYTTFYHRQVPDHLLGRFATTRFSLYSIGSTIGYNLFGVLLDKTPLIVPLSAVVFGALLTRFLITKSISMYRTSVRYSE